MQAKRKEMREPRGEKPWGMWGTQPLCLVSLVLLHMRFTFGSLLVFNLITLRRERKTIISKPKVADCLNPNYKLLEKK